MADDDEVVFEGRELQKYLHEIGYEDFEVVNPHASPPVSPQQVGNSLYSSVSNWFRRPWISVVKPEDQIVLNKHIQLILECGLLFEDDIYFVRNIIPDKGDKCIEIKKSWNDRILNFTSIFPWLSSNVWQEALWPVTGSVFFFLLWSWKKKHQNVQYIMKQQYMLQVMKDLYIIFWKCMKLLQENELILRGFTLAKTGSTVSRLENSELPCMIRKWDSSPGLRIALAKAFVEAVNALSGAIQQLINHCPLFGQLDNSSHYMSYLDENVLGLLRDYQESDVKLSDLKRLHHVFLLLQSEFLRRLALCFCPELWRWKSLKQVKNVMQTVHNISKTAALLQLNLVKEYHVFYSYGTCEGIQGSALLLPFQKSDIFKSTDTKDAVRSVSLHLQVLLLNTRALEEKLEAQRGADECFEDILTHLSNIIHELDVCRSCCEEGIIQVKRLTAPEKVEAIPDQTEKKLVPCINADTQVKTVHVGYTDLDPQVEDEIYEAIISADVPKDASDEDIIINEQMQYERAKQLSKNMMQELKSVLVIKAEKWKEREAKVLQAKQSSPESVPSIGTIATSANDTSAVDTVAVVGSNLLVNISPVNSDASFTAHGAPSNINTTTFSANEETGQEINGRKSSLNLEKYDVVPEEDKLSCISHIKPKTSSLHNSPNRKIPQHKLHGHHARSDCSLEHCTDFPVSNASSSSSQALSNRSPKHVYASETFRPLQNDLQFSMGLHLSKDALAKFKARNIGESDTFIGVGDKSSSEESLVEQ